MTDLLPSSLSLRLKKSGYLVSTILRISDSTGIQSYIKLTPAGRSGNQSLLIHTTKSTAKGSLGGRGKEHIQSIYKTKLAGKSAF